MQEDLCVNVRGCSIMRSDVEECFRNVGDSKMIKGIFVGLRGMLYNIEGFPKEM